MKCSNQTGRVLKIHATVSRHTNLEPVVRAAIRLICGFDFKRLDHQTFAALLDGFIQECLDVLGVSAARITNAMNSSAGSFASQDLR
jgi:hypothetical protein